MNAPTSTFPSDAEAGDEIAGLALRAAGRIERRRQRQNASARALRAAFRRASLEQAEIERPKADEKPFACLERASSFSARRAMTSRKRRRCVTMPHRSARVSTDAAPSLRRRAEGRAAGMQVETSDDERKAALDALLESCSSRARDAVMGYCVGPDLVARRY
jgi:hypothetical protein